MKHHDDLWLPVGHFQVGRICREGLLRTILQSLVIGGSITDVDTGLDHIDTAFAGGSGEEGVIGTLEDRTRMQTDVGKYRK